MDKKSTLRKLGLILLLLIIALSVGAVNETLPTPPPLGNTTTTTLPTPPPTSTTLSNTTTTTINIPPPLNQSEPVENQSKPTNTTLNSSQQAQFSLNLTEITLVEKEKNTLIKNLTDNEKGKLKEKLINKGKSLGIDIVDINLFPSDVKVYHDKALVLQYTRSKGEKGLVIMSQKQYEANYT